MKPSLERMKSSWLYTSFLLVLLMPDPTMGQTSEAVIYHCRLDDAQAVIEIVPERPKGELPCQVVFTDEDGQSRQLWRVAFERGLCVAKAERKRELLEIAGWQCALSVTAPWARRQLDEGRQTAAGSIRETSRSAEGTTAADADRSGRLIDDDAALALENQLAPGQSRRALSLSLEESVSLALRNNRDIESAYLTRTRDALALELAEDEFWPDLEIDAGPTLQRFDDNVVDVETSVTTRLPTGGDISLAWSNQLTRDQGGTSISGEVTQPLWRGSGLDANLADLKNARLNYDRGLLALRGRIIDTVTDVIFAHRALTQAQFRVDVAIRSLKRAEDQQRFNQRLLETGRIARFDAVQNEANIAIREVDLATSRLDLEDARRNLLQLLDIDTDIPLLAEEAVTDRGLTFDRQTALSIAFANRPDFLDAQISDRQTRLALDTARSQGRQLGLDAVLSASRDDVLFSDEDDVFDDGGRTDYRAGLRLNIPFGDVERQQSIQQAILDIRENRLTLREVENSIENDIANLFANIVTAKSRIALAERAESLAEAQLEAERTKFSRGLSSTLDVISLEDSLVDTQLSTLEARVVYSDALTELDRALGMTLDSWTIQLRQE